MGHILPTKFNVDMRKVDSSNLIVSGQMTRDEALVLLQDAPYPSPNDLESDIVFFLKKLGWTRAEWDAYLLRPERPHTDFRSESGLYARIRSLSGRGSATPGDA